jgi:hypothetical protein
MTVNDQQSDIGFRSALADLRCGTILGLPEDGPPDARLESLAAAAPELFASERASWELIFGRLVACDEPQGFQDIVLVSRDHVHVAMRCTRDPSIALIGVAGRNRSVGSIVAEARARLARLTGAG